MVVSRHGPQDAPRLRAWDWTGEPVPGAQPVAKPDIGDADERRLVMKFWATIRQFRAAAYCRTLTPPQCVQCVQRKANPRST